MIDKSVQIFRDGTGLRASGRIGRTAAPSAPIKRDRPIAGFDESGNIVLPPIGVACIGVEQ